MYNPQGIHKKAGGASGWLSHLVPLLSLTRVMISHGAVRLNLLCTSAVHGGCLIISLSLSSFPV